MYIFGVDAQGDEQIIREAFQSHGVERAGISNMSGKVRINLLILYLHCDDQKFIKGCENLLLYYDQYYVLRS